MEVNSLIGAVKIIILGSVFFVWVVRYQNIINEFQEYNLPNWLRDLVGILKLSFVIMLFNNDTNIVIIGSGGIILLMMAAFLTHIKVRNPVPKMIPSLTLMSFSSMVFLFNY
jgi:hypothetical protein